MLNPVQSPVGETDAYTAKLDADGTLVYSGVLRGLKINPQNPTGPPLETQEIGTGVAAHSDGTCYFVGQTDADLSSSDAAGGFPITQGAFDETPGGGPRDSYLVVLEPAGGLRYASFLGGEESDTSPVVEVDASGIAHVGE